MSEKRFNCVEFDDENKRLNVLIGNEGIALYIMKIFKRYLF